MVYFAAHHLGTGSGVMVTGSHNPPDYNGLKMVLGGETLVGRRRSRTCAAASRAATSPTAHGSYAHADVREAYLDAHRRRREARAADEDRRRLRQRRRRRVRARALPPPGLRGRRAVLRSRRQLPQPPSRSVAAGEPAGPDRARCATATPSWASPSTATATASAWSPRTARSSIPTAS